MTDVHTTASQPTSDIGADRITIEHEDRPDADFAAAHTLAPLLTAMQRALLQATRRGPLQFAGHSWKTRDGRIHFRSVTVTSLVDHGLLAVVGKRADTTAAGRTMLDIILR